MLRAAKHFWGDIAISEEFQILARQKMSRPVSAAPPDVVYRFRSEPFTLIRRFRHVSANDALTASVLVATLIRALLDAYGILNRICSMPSTELLNFLAARDPRAASALKRVVESSQQELREHPELLSELAEAIVGKEDRDEFAEPQRTHEGDSHIPPWLKSEATRASQQRTRSGAIKSYEANQRLSEEAVGNIHA